MKLVIDNKYYFNLLVILYMVNLKEQIYYMKEQRFIYLKTNKDINIQLKKKTYVAIQNNNRSI
jgi:hypothetical protein